MAREAEVRLEEREQALGARQLGALHREGQVGRAVVADVLDDHVDVEALLGHGREDGLGDARPVGHADDGDLGDLAVEGQGADLVAQLHCGYLLDAGAGVVAERRAHPDDDVVDPAQLHGARLHDLGALVGQLEHLLVADDGDEPGVGDDARVGREDALHVGVDLAGVGLEAGGQGHGRRVRAATAQRRDLARGEGLVRGALEAGHDDDPPAADLGAHAGRVDVGDARPAVARVRADAGLRSGQRDGLDARRLEGHGHERAADVLAGGEQEVHLARVGVVRDGGRQVEQVVGRVAHGADDDDEVCAGATVAGDPPGDVADALGIGERRAAVLLDDERGHGRSLREGRPDGRASRCPPSTTRAPSARAAWTAARPARPSACARRSMAAAMVAAAAGSWLKAMTVEPAPERQAPSAPGGPGRRHELGQLRIGGRAVGLVETVARRCRQQVEAALAQRRHGSGRQRPRCGRRRRRAPCPAVPCAWPRSRGACRGCTGPPACPRGGSRRTTSRPSLDHGHDAEAAEEWRPRRCRHGPRVAVASSRMRWRPSAPSRRTSAATRAATVAEADEPRPRETGMWFSMCTRQLRPAASRPPSARPSSSAMHEAVAAAPWAAARHPRRRPRRARPARLAARQRLDADDGAEVERQGQGVEAGPEVGASWPGRRR